MNASGIAPGVPSAAGSPEALSTVTNTMLPGDGNCGGSLRSPIQDFMMSIQIGRAAPRAGRFLGLGAGHVGADRLFLIEADPHANRDIGIESDEPRVGVVVGCPGLAAERPV